MIRIENPKVIAAIIDCLNLPISRRCEVALAEVNEITFILDEFANPQQWVKFPVWTNFNIKYWGPEFTVSHYYDIGHWKIDANTGESEYVCCYNTEGKIKYGRYYEPSMD